MRELSEDAKYAINSRERIVMRLIKNPNIIDREFIPIGFSDTELITLYTQSKTTYFNAADIGISHETKKENKDLGFISTIGNQLQETIASMEYAGYKIRLPRKKTNLHTKLR